MKGLMGSVAVGACVLALSAGVAFADNLHKLVPPGAGNGTGQTGSNVFADCHGTTIEGGGVKSNPGVGSPFGPNGEDKRYAGNPGNPTFAGSPGVPAGHSNANRNTAVSQHDNACAQAAAHQLH
jgi:hypothetical protein